MINVAKSVLEHEANAILRMKRKLDSNFTKAVKLIHAAKGPAILIGMGKPALIAQKISASLASTGTSSFTLHPADALHGDLGRITKGSVVILLSNSGETDEITKLLPILKQTKVKIIAITGNVKSSMAKASHVVLDTSVVKETEPLNVAPTASTTCMLAMGDALTMALVKQRKFKKKDFAMLHPGGSLGKQLRLTVKDVMRKGKRNPLDLGNLSVKKVLFKITSAHTGCATVVNKKGECIGIFTDGDLRRHFKEITQGGKVPISKIMTKKPITVKEDLLVLQALKVFESKKIDEIPVVNSKNQVTGLLDIQDLLAEGFMLTQ